MKIYKQTRNFYVSMIVAGSILLSGCGGGGGGGGGGASAPPPLFEDGVFTVVKFHGDETGGAWDIASSAIDCDLDGVDTVYVDSDRDGDFSDEVLTYEVLEDGTLTVDIDDVGAYSEDGSILVTTEVTATDIVNFSMGIRDGSGMSVDTFGGPYLVTKFATNTALGITHTYTAAAMKTGYGIGIFRILQSSDPAAIGVVSPFHYTIEDNGDIFFTDSHEEGKIKSDGSFFIASNTDTTDNLESIMMGIPISDTSGTAGNADLEGDYIGNLIGRNLVTGDYWTARILATFDGTAFVRYEFLASTSGGGGATGYLAYHVYDSGVLMVGPPLEYGAATQDGQTFCLVDTDPSDGQIYMMAGLKKQ
jgi:hypothetical protein